MKTFNKIAVTTGKLLVSILVAAVVATILFTSLYLLLGNSVPVALYDAGVLVLTLFGVVTLFIAMVTAVMLTVVLIQTIWEV